jgi:hypothetical protein
MKAAALLFTEVTLLFLDLVVLENDGHFAGIIAIGIGRLGSAHDGNGFVF